MIARMFLLTMKVMIFKRPGAGSRNLKSWKPWGAPGTLSPNGVFNPKYLLASEFGNPQKRPARRLRELRRSMLTMRA